MFRFCQEVKLYDDSSTAFQGHHSSPVTVSISPFAGITRHENAACLTAADGRCQSRENPRPGQTQNTASVNSKQGRPLRTTRRYRGVVVHKTYTTRRGALLLFSEELAEPVGERRRWADDRCRDVHVQRLRQEPENIDVIETELQSLQTVDALACAVLTYGSKVDDIANF